MQKSIDPEPLALPRADRVWKARRLFPLAGPFAQAADLLILSGVYLGVVLLPPFRRVHDSFPAMLDLSVTLRVAVVAVLCVCTWRVILRSVGVYGPGRSRGLQDYLLRCVIGLNSSTLVVGLIEVVLHSQADLWRVVGLFWLLSLVGMAALRGALLLHAGGRLSPQRQPRTLIIVGSGQRAREAYENLDVGAEVEYRLLGFVDSEPQGGWVPAGMILGGIDDLERVLTETPVDEVTIALPMKSQYEAAGYAIAVCQMLGIQSRYFTDRPLRPGEERQTSGTLRFSATVPEADRSRDRHFESPYPPGEVR